MSELHIGLIGLGALGVLGVVAYNAWVGYHHRKLADRLLDPLEKDALFDAPPAHDALPAQPELVADEAMSTNVSDEVNDRRDQGGAGASDALADDDARTRACVEAVPSAVSSPRWPDAPLLPDAGGVARSAGFASERIEPVLGQAPEEVDAICKEADEDHGARAWHRSSDAADDVEFGEILASRPFGESEIRAPLSADVIMSAHAVAEPEADPIPVLTACDTLSDMPAEPPSRVGEPMHLLSPAIDYIATLEAASGASAAEWLAAQQLTLSRTGKPVHWAGFDEENGEWTMLTEGVGEESDGLRLFRHVRAGLQLVDRQGAISENDLLVFATAMDALAHDWQAQGRPVMLDLPDPRPVPAVAADLDAFCASVDIQISLNVVALNEAFPGTKIRALAESAGMAINGRGRFVRDDDEGNTLYALLSHEPTGFSAESMRSLSTHGLTFLLDVPTVARGERVFVQLVELARRFAEVLKGALVDDNRRPLSDASLVSIRRQVAQFQARMAQRNLPAGGHMARRLFS